MKKLFFLPFLMAAAYSQAQITLTQSDFAAVGDTVHLGNDITNVGSVNVGTASVNAQTWNFSSLSMDGFNSLLFVDPSNAVGNADYPSANIALLTGQTSTFFNKTASGVEILGNGGAAGGFGFSAPYNPPYTILPFPTTLGTSVNASFGFDVTEFIGIDTIINIPPFVSNLHVQLDSVRFRRDGVVDMDFDAHGTVTLPNLGDFQSLRCYNVQTNTDSVLAFLGGPVSIPFLSINLVAGWNVITQELADNISIIAPGVFGGQATGIHTDRSYDWYSNGVGYRMVSVSLDTTAGFPPKRVDYLSSPEFASVTSSELLPAAFVYPNPTAEILSLSGIDANTQGNIAIFDLGGRVVMNTLYTGQTQISVSDLASGTYFFRLTNKQGQLLFADKFEVVK